MILMMATHLLSWITQVGTTDGVSAEQYVDDELHLSTSFGIDIDDTTADWRCNLRSAILSDMLSSQSNEIMDTGSFVVLDSDAYSSDESQDEDVSSSITLYDEAMAKANNLILFWLKKGMKKQLSRYHEFSRHYKMKN